MALAAVANAFELAPEGMHGTRVEWHGEVALKRRAGGARERSW